MRTPDHYSFSQMVMTLGNSDLLIHYPNDIEKAEVFTDAADSLQDAAELTNLPLLRNDLVDDLPDGAALYCPADPNDYRNPIKRKVLLYGTCADGEPFGLNVLDGGLLEKEVSGESYDMYISFNAHAAVTPSGIAPQRRPHRHRGAGADRRHLRFKGWLDLRGIHAAYRRHCRYSAVRRRRREQSQREYRLFCK